MREAVAHVRFCTTSYREQALGGRYFLHEYPLTTSSWELQCTNDLETIPGAAKVTADLGRFGLTSTSPEGTGPAKKPTGFLANCTGSKKN